jgi:Asp-tRNA(Asn)/Glu-tRNA(Gln) amidotransferase A subunit family amidase
MDILYSIKFQQNPKARRNYSKKCWNRLVNALNIVKMSF